MKPRKKINGLGDVVAVVTKTFGIQPCESCIERQKKWNVLHPFNLQSREVSHEEWKKWLHFKNTHTDILRPVEVLFVCNFYASVFNRTLYVPCGGCSSAPIVEMIRQLDKLYKINDNALIKDI